MGLKELRENKGYTRKELSEITGINLRSLQDYEQGHKCIPSMKSESLYRLSLALDCSMEEILDDYYADIEVVSDKDNYHMDYRMRHLIEYRRNIQR